MRTRIPAYVSAYSYVRMQVWHSSVYPWAHAVSGRGSNLVYMHHTARADTGEGFIGQTRDTKSGGGGGGGGGAVRFRPFIHPCTVYLLNGEGEGDLALGRGSINPPPPPPPPTTPLCVEYDTLSRSGTSCYF